MCEKIQGLEVVLLNSKETAAILGISPKSLLNMVHRGLIPFYKLGRRNRYKLKELNELIEKTRRGNK